MIVAFRSAKGRSFAERKTAIPSVNSAPLPNTRASDGDCVRQTAIGSRESTDFELWNGAAITSQTS